MLCEYSYTVQDSQKVYRSKFCNEGDVAPLTESQLLWPMALNRLLVALLAAIEAAAAEAAAAAEDWSTLIPR